MRSRTLPTLLCLATLYAQTDLLPAFEDYPVATRYRGKPALPQFGSSPLPDSNRR